MSQADTQSTDTFVDDELEWLDWEVEQIDNFPQTTIQDEVDTFINWDMVDDDIESLDNPIEPEQ